MRCPTCERPMKPLFTSCVCDYCDGLAEVRYERGFVVLCDEDQLECRPMYLFRTRTDAARWRSAQGLQQFPIREVLTEAEVRWIKTRGRLTGIELADRPFVVFADHRFPPAPDRAFLAPARRRASTVPSAPATPF